MNAALPCSRQRWWWVWTDDIEVARDYGRNSGYGGGYLWEMPTPPQVPSLSVGDLKYYVDDPDKLDVTRGIWHVFDALEAYPEIEDRLRDEGHKWVKYGDPLAGHEDAETYAYIGTEPMPASSLVERIRDTYHRPVPELDARLGIEPEPREFQSEHSQVKALRQEARALDADLRVSLESPPELWSVSDSPLSVKGLTNIRAWLDHQEGFRKKEGSPLHSGIPDSGNVGGSNTVALSGKYAAIAKKLIKAKAASRPRRRRPPKLKSPSVRPPSIKIINR